MDLKTDLLKRLESMWQARVIRKTPTYPEVHYDPATSMGTLNNPDWAFHVPYAFREALDLKYEQRKKDKRPYMIWTQGPFLSFKEGDALTSRDGQAVVQVKFATSMGWDPVKKRMYKGSIIFDKFDSSEDMTIWVSEHRCNQMDFLELLLVGSLPARID